jgi:hypothetical protein
MTASLAFSRAHEERGQDAQARWASSFDSPEGFSSEALCAKEESWPRP